MVCTLALSYGPLLIIPNAKQMGGGGIEIFITLLALGVRVQELCESRGGRRAPSPNEPYGFCGLRIGHSLSLVCQPDIRGH